MPRLTNPGSLFRSAQNVLERRVSPQEHPEVVLRPSSRWAQGITWSLIAATGFSLSWLALAKTDEIVIAKGRLEPAGEVKELQMPVGGVAAKVFAQEGQHVKTGDPLLQLDTENNRNQERNLLRMIALKESQIQLKSTELERYLQLNSTEQRVLGGNLSLQTDVLDRLNRLYKQGAGSELQYLQQRDKVQQVQGEIDKKRDDRLRQISVLDQEREQLRSEVSELRGRLSELQVTIRYQTLKSPVDGVVFDLKPTGPGFVAQTSEPILKIVPFNQLQAKVEIPSKDIGFVKPGQAAELNIDSFPASDFGVLEGKVNRIGSDALPPDPQKQRDDYRYPTLISLNSQQLRLRSGQVLPLQVGMSLTAHIKLRKVTYLQLLLGSFRQKADSLRRV